MKSEPPAVYLDQWALGMIAADLPLADQFVQALADAAGTLCLSWMKLVEFAGSHERSIAEAQCLIERVFPRLFFFDPIPWNVITREDVLITGDARLDPHGDPEVLKALTYLEAVDLRPFAINGLVSQFAEAGRGVEMATLANLFVSRAAELRTAAAKDKDFWRRLTSVPPGPGSQTGTRFFVPQLLRPLVTNRRMRLERNDAADFYHTAVPVCYCDHVLIDKRWASLASQAIGRLRSAGHESPYANVIPAGPTAIRQLLDALENWSAPPGPA